MKERQKNVEIKKRSQGGKEKSFFTVNRQASWEGFPSPFSENVEERG